MVELLNARTGWVKDGELYDGSEEVTPQDVHNGSRYFILIMNNRVMWYRRRDWNKGMLRHFQIRAAGILLDTILLKYNTILSL